MRSEKVCMHCQEPAISHCYGRAMAMAMLRLWSGNGLHGGMLRMMQNGLHVMMRMMQNDEQ